MWYSIGTSVVYCILLSGMRTQTTFVSGSQETLKGQHHSQRTPIQRRQHAPLYMMRNTLFRVEDQRSIISSAWRGGVRYVADNERCFSSRQPWCIAHLWRGEQLTSIPARQSVHNKSHDHKPRQILQLTAVVHICEVLYTSHATTTGRTAGDDAGVASGVEAK